MGGPTRGAGLTYHGGSQMVCLQAMNHPGHPSSRRPHHYGLGGSKGDTATTTDRLYPLTPLPPPPPPATTTMTCTPLVPPLPSSTPHSSCPSPVHPYFIPLNTLAHLYFLQFLNSLFYLHPTSLLHPSLYYLLYFFFTSPSILFLLYCSLHLGFLIMLVYTVPFSASLLHSLLFLRSFLSFCQCRVLAGVVLSE